MSELQEKWAVWREDGRGWYLVNDPEITFDSEEEADAYCDEHNRALAGQAAIAERKRITDIIHDRVRVIRDTIENCAKNGLGAPLGFFDLEHELQTLRLEIEKEPIT